MSESHSLWWFDRAKAFYVETGEVRSPRAGEVALVGGEPYGYVLDVRPEHPILRPARLFTAEDGTEYVESGETVEHVKKGQCFIGEYSDGFQRAEHTCRFDCDSPPVPLLIPIAEARELCGLDAEGENLEARVEALERRVFTAERQAEWLDRKVIEDLFPRVAALEVATEPTQAEPLGEAPEIPVFEGTRAALDGLSVRKGE